MVQIDDVLVLLDLYIQKIESINGKNTNNLESNITEKFNIVNSKIQKLAMYSNDIYNEINKIKTNKKNNFLEVDSISVRTEKDIPNTHIYYIESTKEYGIKINNNLVKGNLGIIYNKNEKCIKKRQLLQILQRAFALF